MMWNIWRSFPGVRLEHILNTVRDPKVSHFYQQTNLGKVGHFIFGVQNLDYNKTSPEKMAHFGLMHCICSNLTSDKFRHMFHIIF